MKRKEDNYDKNYYKSLTGEEAFTQRMNGRLPIIEIHGHPFFIEVRWGMLRPKDNLLSDGINLNNAGEFIDNHYEIYYDTKSMSEAVLSSDITKLPKNVVMIEVPNMYDLDPVMMARMTGKDPRTYLKQFPMKMYRVAKAIPIQESPLVAIVQKNLQKLNALLSARQLRARSNSSGGKRKGRGL